MLFGDWLHRVRRSRVWSRWDRRFPKRRRALAPAVQIETLQPREMLTTQIDISDAVVLESDGSGYATVTVTGDPQVADLIVSYTLIANGSATVGDDFSSSSGSITIEVGNTSGLIGFSVNDDLLSEPSETFGIQLGVTGLPAAEVD